ncbi:MAG: NAD(P)H-hydrate dehydratase [Acidobacteria bacterium]|nr:NAD(P)H-hydrate dehydratase [Acidobacteriota bacterium]
MRVLTAAEMREVDRLTIEAGIPSLILMENAAHRVLEALQREFAPLRDQRIVVFCGKGNNGGDGLAVARLLHAMVRPAALDVVLASAPELLAGDAAANYRMLRASGFEAIHNRVTDELRGATLLIDALLGTGIEGDARGRPAELIVEMSFGFPGARICAVDLPSGMQSDSGDSGSPVARCDLTVTFTAPKVCHALAPNCDRIGKLVVGRIGSPDSLLEEIPRRLLGPSDISEVLEPRAKGGHKGTYGHVLVLAGSRGKPGAAALAGMAALRSGAGLVTVASAESVTGAIGAHAPELMMEGLAETPEGGIADQDVEALLRGKSVVAIGPGMGLAASTVALVRRLIATCTVPMIVDADALNALAGREWPGAAGPRVLTPHPGEMARLLGHPVTSRLDDAREFAKHFGLTLLLKGQRTVIATPDGNCWINPTGTPAMATAGSGDVLTGMLAGLTAQNGARQLEAVLAAAWLHGKAGECAAAVLGEMPVTATDLLRFLPEALRAAHA